MVSERLSKVSFGEALNEIFHNDLPVYVSTDAILHAFHISYDRILRDLEVELLIPKVSALLDLLHSKMPELHQRYQSNPQMNVMLRDVDVYITVGRKLFNNSAQPYYTENSAWIENILSNIYEEEPVSDTLFSSTCKVIDWSQFKPRGHYVDFMIPELSEYFRVMMWLGRIELYLIKPVSSYPCPKQTNEDIQRQIIDAMLIEELFDIAQASDEYEYINNILKYFVGEQDNVTFPHLTFLKEAVQLQQASDLLDTLKLKEFQDTLKNQSFANQLILSQILFQGNWLTPETIVPASAFMLFGQRFVIDSYVTAGVVFDKIYYNGEKICRLFPSTLDPMFALGNDAAAQLIKDELEQFHYSTNLAAARYLIDSFDPEYWKSSIYNYWLGSIRKLNPPDSRDNLPSFMKTAAFWQKMLNTQLSSWTQLRHDNLLYAKQSYTGGTICSFPYSYVEPFPEFYFALRDFASESISYFQQLNWNAGRVTDYMNDLKNITDTLGTIAQKELDGIELSQAEKDFLKMMLYPQTVNSGVPPYSGWYPRLFYRDFEYSSTSVGTNAGLLDAEYIAADIHTTPTDCFGGIYGWISHVGTGKINMAVFIAELPGEQLTAFIGPVMSFHEYRTDNFFRISDEEWKETYLNLSQRPDWVNIYLADSTGDSRGEGATLITSVYEDPDNTEIPKSHLIVNHYPNPFNPSVTINFTIPYDLTNSLTELVVYDITGQKIKTLVNDVLQSGNYFTRWDATTDNGSGVSSGIYFYVLNVGSRQVSGKMIYQK
jgi:hypothetical protein